MWRWSVLLVGWLWATLVWAQVAQVGVSIVKTARVDVVEALLVPGGSVTQTRPTNFSAFLVRHGQNSMLFDTGLGRGIGAQYQQDMPVWWRPFFRYGDAVLPAVEQLQQAGMPAPQRVVLSHSHWDHASGVSDFPAARIAVAAAELARVRQPSTGPGGTWGSQLGGAGIAWEALAFSDRPFMGYAQSLDVYGDGTVVLVPMPGHTPGSVGLFVTVDSGQRYFLIGDVAWTLEALEQGAAKFWVAGKLVDSDASGTQLALERVRDLARADPSLVVIPAHDGVVQDRLGYFPRWLP